MKGVVYKVDCSCGNTYIGETGRTLGVRLKEHKRAVTMDQPNNGIAVHANKTRHDILWDSAEVLLRTGDKLDQAEIQGTSSSPNPSSRQDHEP